MRTRRPSRLLPAWRRWAAGWALVALFGVALAPSVSRWLQLVRGVGPGELAALCVAPGAATPGGAPSPDIACALCVLAQAAPLTGVPAAPPVATPSLRHVLVAGALPVGRPAEAPRRAVARAPPAIA